MADDQDVELDANAKGDIPLLCIRMLWIRDYPREVVMECRLGILKGHTVLHLIRSVVVRVPLKAEVVCNYSVRTPSVRSRLTPNAPLQRRRAAPSAATGC